jgi:MFS transporter, MHS family, shikimate and dehydroshikimate transport protein
MVKIASAGTIGALMEWYDFYIFATGSALVFGHLFFPGSDPLAGTMASFGAFAAGFLARPLGGVLFGHIGDTLGRKASLVATLLIIGLGTFLIGLLPTYESIGFWAPLLLVLLRVVQGVGLGGEYAGASLITIEHAPRSERGFWGSLPQAASPGGLLMASGIFSLTSLLPQEDFQSWGWRVPFLLSVLMLLVGIFIRLQITETPDFEDAKGEDTGEVPGLELFRAQRWSGVLATGARLVETVSGNMIKSFGLTYVTMQLTMPKEVALTALTATSVLGVLATPLYGAIGDRFGQRRVYMLGTAMVAILAFPFFWLLDWRTTAATWIGFVTTYNLGPTLLLSLQPSLFARLFRARVRYTGLSMAYQVSSIVGGFTPLVSLWLLRISGGTPWLVAAFMVVIAAVSLGSVAALTLPQVKAERRGAPIDAV